MCLIIDNDDTRIAVLFVWLQFQQRQKCHVFQEGAGCFPRKVV